MESLFCVLCKKYCCTSFAVMVAIKKWRAKYLADIDSLWNELLHFLPMNHKGSWVDDGAYGLQQLGLCFCWAALSMPVHRMEQRGFSVVPLLLRKYFNWFMKGGVKLELQGRFILLLFFLWNPPRNQPPLPSAHLLLRAEWQSHHVQAMNSGFTAMRHNYNGGGSEGGVSTVWEYQPYHNQMGWQMSVIKTSICHNYYTCRGYLFFVNNGRGEERPLNWVGRLRRKSYLLGRPEELLKVHYALEWPDRTGSR